MQLLSQTKITHRHQNYIKWQKFHSHPNEQPHAAIKTSQDSQLLWLNYSQTEKKKLGDASVDEKQSALSPREMGIRLDYESAKRAAENFARPDVYYKLCWIYRRGNQEESEKSTEIGVGNEIFSCIQDDVLYPRIAPCRFLHPSFMIIYLALAFSWFGWRGKSTIIRVCVHIARYTHSTQTKSRRGIACYFQSIVLCKLNTVCIRESTRFLRDNVTDNRK
jgi:hypothetical protein